jgi:hypothetical protein
MGSLRLNIVVKRLTEVGLFMYLAVVMTFLQLDIGLVCRLTTILRSRNHGRLAAVGFSVLALSFFAIVLITLWTRYVLRSQAVLASVIYVSAFSVAAASGVSLRLIVAPGLSCQNVPKWPPDCAQGLAIGYATVLAASIFVAVLNLISPQKVDYSDVRVKLTEYLTVLPTRAETDQQQRAQLVPKMKTVSEALEKAYDSFGKSMSSESSPAYREFIATNFLRPLEILCDLATGIDEGHPEEFLKRIGYRDPGLAPTSDVSRGCDAQRKIERAWRRRES